MAQLRRFARVGCKLTPEQWVAAIEKLESVEQDYSPLWGSILKQAIRRVYPGFNETYYGYRSFTHLLQDAANLNIIETEREPRGRGFIITRFGEADVPRITDAKPQATPRKRKR